MVPNLTELVEDENPPPQMTPREQEQELMSLAPQEVAEIEADILGLTTRFEGTHLDDSKANEALLSELDDAVENIPNEVKAAFNEARRRDPRLVDNAHRRAFLWREHCDIQRAAQRLVAYWEFRRQLFGPEKCYLPLTLTGALRDDLVALSQGFVRLLPFKDSSGRSMIYFDPSKHHRSRYSHDSMLRAFWYFAEASCEDEDARRRGNIWVAFPKNAAFEQFDHKLFASISRLDIDVLPFRARSFHLCHPDRFFYIFSPILKFLLGKRIRERFIVHYGSNDEVLQQLSKFGISPDCLPSDFGGGLVSENMELWVRNRLAQECQHAAIAVSEVMHSAGASSAVSHSNLPPPATTTTTTSTSLILAPPNEDITNSARDDVGLKLAEVEGERSSRREKERNQRHLGISSDCLTSDLGGGSVPESIEQWVRKRLYREGQQAGISGPVVMSSVGASSPVASSPVASSPVASSPVPRSMLPPPAIATTITSPTLALPYENITNSAHDDVRFKLAEVEGERSSWREKERNHRIAEIHVKNAGKLTSKHGSKPVASSADKCFLQVGASSDASKKKQKGSDMPFPGRKGDMRMNKAVEARMKNEDLSLFDALRAGGFVFPNYCEPGTTDGTVYDTENVSLMQRKNQLNRRLRAMKGPQQKNKKTREKKGKNKLICATASIAEGTAPKSDVNMLHKNVHNVEDPDVFLEMCDLLDEEVHNVDDPDAFLAVTR